MDKKPYDYMEECKALQQYYKNEGDAEAFFKRQGSDLEKISKTKGYEHIKEFFLRQYNDGLQALEGIDLNNKTASANIQGKTQLSKKFLIYLEARDK